MPRQHSGRPASRDQFAALADRRGALFAASLALTRAQEAPDALVKRVAEDVLQTIRGDKDLQAGNQAQGQAS